MAERSAILLVDASESSANMYYATRIFTPDAFIYLETEDERLIVIGNLELERAKKESSADRVLPLVHYWKLAQDKHGIPPSTAEVVDVLLEDLGIDSVVVPPDFSVKFADGIRDYGYAVQWKPEPFFERRLIKTDVEVKAMTETIRHNEEAIRRGIELIRKADIDSNERLVLNGKPLSAEDVKRHINGYLMEMECIATHTIVSCGEQTAIPHHEGEGPLYANRPITIDVFPRSLKNGYYADMCRTVVRGTATDALKQQFEAVLEAQELAISQLHPGANGKDVHAKAAKFFSDHGFKTHTVDGKPQGFFHATGHGLGVDAHERPRLALKDEYIQPGNVLAVEPGLYYTGIGGIRIEDNILVTEDGPKSLTTLEKVLEI